jgi:prepilin-type N-terminal cleavage/methylation domain-containing protein
MKVLVNKRNNKLSQLKQAGFTMIELLVVLGIFAVIMGVALFNQASLSSNVLITNLAYETALAVREAQTYGISVKSTASSTLDESTFDKGYGAFFDTSNNNQIIVFGDSDGSNSYTDSSEIQSVYRIQNQRGNRIQYICVGIATPLCNATNSLDLGKKLSIMFKRPNP